jgi:hypothetical protein
MGIAWMSIWHLPQTLDTVAGEFKAMESTQHKPGKDSIKSKEKKKFNTFFTIIVSAITLQEADEYENGGMPNINGKEEDREMKKTLMQKFRQSWMCCSKQ